MSKNLKALLEKRNAKVTEATDILDAIESEARALTGTENDKLVSLQTEIMDLDKSINKAKEIRGLAKADDKNGGTNDMTEKLKGKELEIRGLEQYLRNQNGEELQELRALTGAVTAGNMVENTAGNGGITIPTGVSDTIIEEMTETSPVFAMARKFGSVTGNLKVARESGIDDDGFIGELADATKLQPKFKSVTLTQKRVGAAIQLTNSIINDSGVNIVGYAQGRLSRSAVKAVEYAILRGAKGAASAAETFKPIIGDTDVEKINTVAVEPTLAELITIYGSINPGYLDGSAFIVSRKVFNSMLQLQDGDNQYLILRDQVNGKPGFTLFGVPVYVSSALTGAPAEIVFGNIEAAYGMLIKTAMNLVTVNADSTQALGGGTLLVLDAYMDGAVINPEAVVTAVKK